MSYFNKSTFVKFILSITLSLSFFIASAFSKAALIDAGPMIGEKAPALTVINKNKQIVSIDDLTADKGLIILFFRSADWCPYCKRHLIELNKSATKFKTLGYGLSAISYDNIDILNEFSEIQKMTYPLLSDQSAETVKAYNILNTQYKMGDENYGIPYPGVVVINSDGDVTYKYFYEGYKKRIKFTELYEKLSTVK